MKQFPLALCLLGVITISAGSSFLFRSNPPPMDDTRIISLTFDDIPKKDSPFFTTEERSRRLLLALKEANVRRAGFFCVTGDIDPKNREVVQNYAKSGHALANHTHSHPRLSEVGSEFFIKDLVRAHKILADFPGFKKWFRFPGMDYGPRHFSEPVFRKLDQLGYQLAYATVDIRDWELYGLFKDGLAKGLSPDLNSIGKAYVATIADQAEQTHQLFQQSTLKSVKHVLLLHENDLAALFIQDVVYELRNRGWTIRSPDHVFRQPIADFQEFLWVLTQATVNYSKLPGFELRIKDGTFDLKRRVPPST